MKETVPLEMLSVVVLNWAAPVIVGLAAGALVDKVVSKALNKIVCAVVRLLPGFNPTETTLSVTVKLVSAVCSNALTVAPFKSWISPVAAVSAACLPGQS